MISEEMYRENILDHFKHPHNHGVIKNPSAYHKEYNPACGDVVEIYLIVDNNVVKDVKFSGHGCAISQAAASMLTDKIAGMPIAAILQLKKDDILEMLKIPISATRIKCALLCLRTIEKAIINVEGAKHELKNK